MSRNVIWLLIAAVAALVAPLFLYEIFLMKVLCFALFACAFNLLLGYVGLLSFGHAVFFGFAAYVTGYVVKFGANLEIALHKIRFLRWLPEVAIPIQFGPLSPELGILLGTATAGLLGLIIGLLAIRRQGIYFAMITLALSQMVFFFCLQTPRFTGGEDGIQAIPRGALFGVLSLQNNLTLYYFVLAVFTLAFALIYRTIHSPFGQVLKAIRDNEPRAISLGYRTDHYKVAAFVLSASLAGLAGSTKVLVFQLASLTDVHWSMSGEVVLMTLIGGVGTVVGPIVGAAVIIGIQNYLAQFGAWVTIMQGVIFVACVLLFRKGIVGELMAFINKRRGGSDKLDPIDEGAALGRPTPRAAE